MERLSSLHGGKGLSGAFCRDNRLNLVPFGCRSDKAELSSLGLKRSESSSSQNGQVGIWKQNMVAAGSWE